MNIFIMILLAVFMTGYYIIASPSQRIREQETEYAITHADLRGIAECAVAAHNAQIRGNEFNDICVSQNDIQTQTICLNSGGAKTKCEIVRNKKPAASYIITTTGPLPDADYNSMMEILEKYYSDAGTFGIFGDGQIMAGGTSNKRTVPKTIISEMELVNGQLVYLTQYEIPDNETEFTTPITVDIDCPTGTVKTYRFGRWQCIGYNTKTNCGGDMIWDSDLGECVADESRKPLCAEQQTAVLVDSVWECVNPFPDKTCPNNMIARLNYNTLEWECVADPNKTENLKKCTNFTGGAVYGAVGATLRVGQTSCTDCEKMITDPDTCVSYCIPDASQINNPNCYPGTVRDCSGPSRAFYFGFPSFSYMSNVPEISGKYVPLDRAHSQNRKFNCLDCGDGIIDATRSVPPYTAVCQ